MSKKNDSNKFEIDLIKIIPVAWKQKWIFGFILAVVVTSSLFVKNLDKKVTSMTSTIEIVPLFSSQEEKYRQYNSLVKFNMSQSYSEVSEFFQINSDFLLKLYIEELQKRKVFEYVFRKNKLIDRDNFQSEFEYKDAIEKLVSQIEIINPPNELNENNRKNRMMNKYWTIKYINKNEKKWLDAFKEVDDLTNETVKNIILERFQNSVTIEEEKKKLKLISINQKLNNTKKNLENEVKNRIKFLKEQAEIARSLNIIDRKINISDLNTLLNQNDKNYYLRGYASIEKEIQILQSRKKENTYLNFKNIKFYNLSNYETQKNNLENDLIVENAKILIQNTPLHNSKKFKSVNIKINPADIKYSKFLDDKYVVILITMTLVILIIYILFINAISRQKK